GPSVWLGERTRRQDNSPSPGPLPPGARVVGLLARHLRRVIRWRSHVDGGRAKTSRVGEGDRLREGAGRLADVLLDRPLLRPEQLATEPGASPFVEAKGGRVNGGSPSP